METREFATAVIASLTSGVALCEFPKIHEAAEYLMGHPIWTHHFADRALWHAMQRKVLEQCPGIPIALAGVTPENYLERIGEIEAEVGPTVTIRKGDGKTAMDPMDGIPANKPIITIRSK